MLDGAGRDRGQVRLHVQTSAGRFQVSDVVFDVCPADILEWPGAEKRLIGRAATAERADASGKRAGELAAIARGHIVRARPFARFDLPLLDAGDATADIP